MPLSDVLAYPALVSVLIAIPGPSGVGAVLRAWAWALLVIKLCGALYLVFLGVSAIRLAVRGLRLRRDIS